MRSNHRHGCNGWSVHLGHLLCCYQEAFPLRFKGRDVLTDRGMLYQLLGVKGIKTIWMQADGEVQSDSQRTCCRDLFPTEALTGTILAFCIPWGATGFNRILTLWVSLWSPVEGAIGPSEGALRESNCKLLPMWWKWETDWNKWLL